MGWSSESAPSPARTSPGGSTGAPAGGGPRRLLRLAVPMVIAGLALGTAAPAAAGGRGPVSDEIIETVGNRQVVSLTFDDGPDPTHTPALLEVLREHRVRAVFCLWGEHVREHPELVRRIVREGHVLCNHSTRHADLSALTPEQIRADLLETDAAIRDAVAGARVPFFRAPFGSWGESPRVAAELGMRSLGWRLAVSDWEPPGTDELVRRLDEGREPGAVILLHDGGGDRSQTVAAVDRIIPAWQAQGWRFVTPNRHC